jgi:5'-deoxynucleotidase YfbR-like HD superfamily hydrolase
VDIGFDHSALIESLTLDLSAKEANDHRSLEKVEDEACERFFDIMTSHIDQLFPPKGW